MIINNKQSNLLLKTWLRLRPFLNRTTPAPLLFSKIVKTPVGVHSDTPAPVHLLFRPLMPLLVFLNLFFNLFIYLWPGTKSM